MQTQQDTVFKQGEPCQNNLPPTNSQRLHITGENNVQRGRFTHPGHTQSQVNPIQGQPHRQTIQGQPDGQPEHGGFLDQPGQGKTNTYPGHEQPPVNHLPLAQPDNRQPHINPGQRQLPVDHLPLAQPDKRHPRHPHINPGQGQLPVDQLQVPQPDNRHLHINPGQGQLPVDQLQVPQPDNRQPHINPGQGQLPVDHLQAPQPDSRQLQVPPGHDQFYAPPGHGWQPAQPDHGRPPFNQQAFIQPGHRQQPNYGQPHAHLDPSRQLPFTQPGHGFPHTQPSRGQPHIQPVDNQQDVQPSHWHSSIQHMPFTHPGHEQAQQGQGRSHALSGHGQLSVSQELARGSQQPSGNLPPSGDQWQRIEFGDCQQSGQRQPPKGQASIPAPVNRDPRVSDASGQDKRYARQGPNEAKFQNSGNNSHNRPNMSADNRPKADHCDKNRPAGDHRDYNKPSFVRHTYDKRPDMGKYDNHRSRVNGYDRSHVNRHGTNRLNGSFDRSRNEISDKENDRIVGNPWADVNNNVPYKDNHDYSKEHVEHFRDRYRPSAFSSHGPYNRVNHSDDFKRRENQPRRQNDGHSHKSTCDNIRQFDRRYDYRRSSNECRSSRDPRQKNYKPTDHRRDELISSSRKTYENQYEKRYEMPHRPNAPGQVRENYHGPPQREALPVIADRNQDIYHARGDDHQPNYLYATHENERMIDSHRTNTKEVQDRTNVNHKANTIDSNIPSRVNQSETFNCNQEANTPKLRGNEMVHTNHRAHHVPEDYCHRENHSSQQHNGRHNDAVPEHFEKGIPIQVVANAYNRPSMNEYLNQDDGANVGRIRGICPSRNFNVNTDVEQDKLNNNSSLENTFDTGSSESLFQNLPSMVTDNFYRDPSKEFKDNAMKRQNIENGNNMPNHFGNYLKSGLDINGNICPNMDTTDNMGNIHQKNVCSEMKSKDIHVSEISFPDCKPNKNLPVRGEKQGEKIIEGKRNKEMYIPPKHTTNVNPTEDPYHINENLSHIRQQCYKSDKDANYTSKPTDNWKDYSNSRSDLSEVNNNESCDRNKEIERHPPPEAQNNHKQYRTGKDSNNTVAICGTYAGENFPNEMTDFSFLKCPPPLLLPPVASAQRDKLSMNTQPQPSSPYPSKRLSSKSAPSKTCLHELEDRKSQFTKSVEPRKAQAKPSQTKLSQETSMNLKTQAPAKSNSFNTKVTKSAEKKGEPVLSKAPPPPPHEILQNTETECNGILNAQEKKKDVNNNEFSSLKKGQKSETLKQNSTDKSEKLPVEKGLNDGPLEKNDKSSQPKNFRIPLKGDVTLNFRPFRPWETCSSKEQTRKKNKSNYADQRKVAIKMTESDHRKVASRMAESNAEVNDTEIKKLMKERNRESDLGKKSKTKTKHSSNERSSMKSNQSTKPRSRRKRQKKESPLRKLLSKSVPYMELLKLSEIAKPKVNTISSGLTSVVNQVVDPNTIKKETVQSCLRPDKGNEAEKDHEVKKEGHFKTRMEFHKLGLGNKSLLKPHGEKTTAELHKLKSPLDLGSMENLNKIAKGIKQKAKWLERHKSILKEVNKATKLNGKSSQNRKESSSGARSSRKSGKINLTSLHPKMRHKIEKLSHGSPVELDEELINTMPKVSVGVKKCDNYISSRGLKIDKAAFMKSLKLLKKKIPAKKFANLMKRGKFTMPTPTTYIVKPKKVVKHRTHSEVCHTDESDIEDESDRLDRACEAAKQRLLERQSKTIINAPEPVVEKETLEDNSDEDENKFVISEEDSIPANTRGSSVTKSMPANNEVLPSVMERSEPEMPKLWPESEEEDLEQQNRVATELDTQLKEDEICSQNAYTEAVNDRSPTTSQCTGSPEDTSTKELDKVYTSEMENKTTAGISNENNTTDNERNENLQKTNFSINSLIKSEKRNMNDQGEGVMVKAEVYHIEHRYIERRVAYTSYQMDVNENQSCLYESPMITEDGTDNNEYRFCEEVNNSLEWKRDGDDDDGYTEMDESSSKPFIAVPLDLPDKQENLDLTETMIDFGLEDMKTDEAYGQISDSQNVLDNDIVQNFQNDTEKSLDTHLSKLDNNVEERFDCQNNVNFSIVQQNMYDPMIMGNYTQSEITDTNDENLNNLIQVDSGIDDESCKRNFFESIVNDVMHDEDLMKDWAEEIPGEIPEENNETVSNGLTSPLKLSPVSECSDVSGKGSEESETVLECEMQENGSQNQSKDRQTASFNEVVTKFSPFVSLEKLAHSSETVNTNNGMHERDGRFISERTPMRVRDIRKRKYVKRFPVPLPRVKTKDHDQEKELYEAAKKFLGDFNDTVKRACRMKKAIKEEQKTTEVETENACKELKQVHNEEIVEEPKSLEVNNECEKKEEPCKCKDNEGVRSNAKKVEQEMIQIMTSKETSNNDNCDENLKSPSTSRKNKSKTNLCFVKSLKKGTKRKSPILIISKGHVTHDTGNKLNEDGIELKRIKVESVKGRTSGSSEGNQKISEKIQKNAMKGECVEKTEPKPDLSRWCVRCSIMFPSQELKKRHVRNDHDVKSPCSICGVELGNHTAYRRHLGSQIHQKNLAELQKLSPSGRSKKKSQNQLLMSAKPGKSDDELREIERILKSPDKLPDDKKKSLEKTVKLLRSIKSVKDKAHNVNNKNKNEKDKVPLLRSPKSNLLEASKIKSPKNTVQKNSTKIVLKSPKAIVRQKAPSKERAGQLLKSPHKVSVKTPKAETEKIIKSPKLSKLKLKQGHTQKTASKNTETLIKSPKLEKYMKSPKLEKLTIKSPKREESLSECGKGKDAKIKGKKFENEAVEDMKPKHIKTIEIKGKKAEVSESEHYCGLCEQHYSSKKGLKKHLTTEKHMIAVCAAQGSDGIKGAGDKTQTGGTNRIGLTPLKIRKSVRKESNSSEVNSSIDYSESEYYQDQVFGNQTDDENNDGFQLPPTYFELSDGEKLRQLALENPTFLVKDYRSLYHPPNVESDPPGNYEYLGVGLKGQGYSQGEGHLSSSAIGGIVRESYVSLLSSEDETIDPPYRIYQNLDSADESCSGNETPNKGTGENSDGTKPVNTDIGGKETGSEKDRPLSISSEDADFAESVLAGTGAAKVTKLKTPPLSPNPICRIQSCYSLAYKGEQRDSK